MIEIPDDWNGDSKSIHKLFTFDSFQVAINFMAQVALFCEQIDHHPEWKNIYDKVWVDLTTHNTGGLTEKDLVLAKYMDEVAGNLRVQ